MNQLSVLLAAVLTIIAAVHFTWATGIVWPCKDERTLARTVVGTKGIEAMPERWMLWAAGATLILAAVWALLLRRMLPFDLPRLVILIGGMALAYVFVLRGILGILPSFHRVAPEQPFVRLNLMVYSPLSLAIGASFILLVAAWPNWTWRLGLIF
ncbi:MAG: DUF3995 domain-containing protein [Pseudomonadota bacterium]